MSQPSKDSEARPDASPEAGTDSGPGPGAGRHFLLTDTGVLVQEEATKLWRSVSIEDPSGPSMPGGPTPAQLRLLRRQMHPAGKARPRPSSRPAAGGDGSRMEIYDPLTASWAPVPATAGRAQVGETVCCLLPDGTFLIGGLASASCATYDPGTNRWSTSATRSARGASRGPGPVIAIRLIPRG
jgi:hypothetical protein